MAIHKAIKFFDEEILRLSKAPEINGCEMTDEWREQLEICKLAKSALEKQIPKKPIKNKKFLHSRHTVDVAECPNCNSSLGLCNYAKTTFKCCGDCGQALDWGERV